MNIVVLTVYGLDLNQLGKRFVTLRFCLVLQIFQEHIFCMLPDQGSTLYIPHVVQIFEGVGIGVFVKLSFEFLDQDGFLILFLLAPAVVDVVEAHKVRGLAVGMFLCRLLGYVLVLLKHEIGEMRPESE